MSGLDGGNLRWLTPARLGAGDAVATADSAWIHLDRLELRARGQVDGSPKAGDVEPS